MLETYEWGRPEGLWLLALPILLLLLTRLTSRPPTMATGTLEIWKQIAAGGGSDGRRLQHRVPLSIWILALGLCAGALALGDPRPVQAARVQSVTCVVDTSPSMFLPLGNGTRLERAAALAQDWLSANTTDEDEVKWVRFVGGVGETERSATLPAAWQVAPRASEGEVRWSDWDQVGTLWLSDQVPSDENVAAVLIASGGEAVPGMVAASGTARFDWNGVGIEKVDEGAEAGTVSWSAKDAERLAPEVLEFARIWATQRGFTVGTAADASTGDRRLELRAGGGQAEAALLGRDGWRFEGQATYLAPGTGTVWLSGDAGEVVRSSPGLIECGLTHAAGLGGDTAAFAVSWAELFDRAVLPPRGAVSVSERSDAGEEIVRVGSLGSGLTSQAPSSDGVLPAAWLATCAFVLALLALLAGQRTRVR